MKVIISYLAVLLVIIFANPSLFGVQGESSTNRPAIFDDTAAIDSEPPQILLASRYEINAISISSGNQTNIVDSLVVDAIDVDYDYEDEQIFYSDITLDKIYLISNVSATNNFSTPMSPEAIAQPEFANAIAYDWVHKVLYWASDGGIWLVTLKGRHRLTIVNTDLLKLAAIAVDPREDQGWVYWSGFKRSLMKPMIERAGLDGSHRTSLVETKPGWPTGLTIDYASNRLYWIANSGTISSSDLNGQNVRVVLSDARLPRYPFSIDVLGNFVYWDTVRTKEIYEINTNNIIPNARIVKRTTRTPRGIRVYHRTRQPKGVDPCGENNGDCSHICLAAPAIGSNKKKFNCFCPGTLSPPSKWSQPSKWLKIQNSCVERVDQ